MYLFNKTKMIKDPCFCFIHKYYICSLCVIQQVLQHIIFLAIALRLTAHSTMLTLPLKTKIIALTFF